MQTCGCSNLTIAYLQHRLYSPVAMPWCGPAPERCPDHPAAVWHGRVDRVECSPESMELCRTASAIGPPQKPDDRPEQVPMAGGAGDPPPIYERPIVLAVLTPVVQGSMLDILA